MESKVELPFSTLLWQPRPSTWLVTVVCKATFNLEPNELTLAKSQEPVIEGDAFWDDDEARSLSTASDLVPSKPKADVIVVGSAFAPKGKPARSLVVRLGFETIDKSIEVVTDRSVGPDGTVYQGPRFARMPLIYERAAGGPGTWNPVGVQAGSRDAYGRAPLPNLTPKGKGDEMMVMPEPVGLGPIAATWPLRADKLGYHRAAFSGRSWLREPLPEGLDLSFFNVAPADQQIDAIPDDAPLLLENLHRDHPALGTKLPGIRPRVSVERRAGPERPAMRADTLWIDTDRNLVTVTWRGHFALEHQHETYRVTAAAERPRESWRTVEHDVAAPRMTVVDAMERTADGSPLPSGFVAPSTPPASSAPLERRAARTTDAARIAAAGALPFQNVARATRDALPFAQGGAKPSATDKPPAPASPPTPVPVPQQTGTMQIASGLPFGASAAPDAASPSIPAWSGGFGPPPPPPPAPPPPPSFGSPPLAPALPQPQQAPAPAVSQAPVLQPQIVGAPAEGWKPGKAAPPPPVLTHASSAALGGLVSASNAAADPRGNAGVRGVAPKQIDGDVLHLIWFNPEGAARVRRRPEWKKLLDQLEQGPFDPEVDEPALADDPAEMEDRREVYEVLARGTPSGQDSVDRALLDAVRADGRFAAQLLLLLGEVRFDFDEIETLKATVSAVTPFTENDPELKKNVDAATHFLATPGLVAAPDVATAMTTKVREAFAVGDHPVPGTYLEDQTERALLERRAYQKRPVFGEPHLRCLFYFVGSTTGIPTYLPESVGKKLPLYRRIRARLLVEAHFQADQYEAHAAALKAVAIARVVR